MNGYPLHYTVEDHQLIFKLEDELLLQYEFAYPAKIVLEALMNQACDQAVVCGLSWDDFINRCAEKFDKVERINEEKDCPV